MNISYKPAMKAARDKRRFDMSAAEALAKKSKFRTEKPISRRKKLDNESYGDSIFDILNRAHCLGFLSEDDVRKKMREISSLINTPRF